MILAYSWCKMFCFSPASRWTAKFLNCYIANRVRKVQKVPVAVPVPQDVKERQEASDRQVKQVRPETRAQLDRWGRVVPGVEMVRLERVVTVEGTAGSDLLDPEDQMDREDRLESS